MGLSTSQGVDARESANPGKSDSVNNLKKGKENYPNSFKINSKTEAFWSDFYLYY